jgi:hypothetical protein
MSGEQITEQEREQEAAWDREAAAEFEVRRARLAAGPIDEDEEVSALEELIFYEDTNDSLRRWTPLAEVGRKYAERRRFVLDFLTEHGSSIAARMFERPADEVRAKGDVYHWRQDMEKPRTAPRGGFKYRIFLDVLDDAALDAVHAALAQLWLDERVSYV